MYKDIEAFTAKLRETMEDSLEMINEEDNFTFTGISDTVAKNLTVSLSESIDFEMHGIDVYSQDNICGQFGSATSTDLDIFIVLDTPMYKKFRDAVRNYLSVWLEGMISARSSMDYTHADIHFVTISDGVVDWTESNNPTEMNNAIYTTYKYHQMNTVSVLGDYRDCPVKRLVRPEIGIKALKSIRSLITYFSRTHLKEDLYGVLFDDSLKSRIDTIIQVYDSNGGILSDIDTFNKPNTKDEDILKSIAMMFLQLSQMIEGKEVVYTKEKFIGDDYAIFMPTLLRFETETVNERMQKASLDQLIYDCLEGMLEIIDIDENGYVKIKDDRHIYDIRKEKILSIGEYLCV